MDEYRVSPEMAKALPADWNGRTAYSVPQEHETLFFLWASGSVYLATLIPKT